MAIIGAMEPYFGCKRKQIPGIVSAIGPHRVYWELTCGSLSVLFGKPPSRQEVVNDLHEAVINVARVVQDDSLSVKLFDRLQRTLFCESLYKDSQDECTAFFMEEDRRKCDLDWAYHYLVVSWMGRNGLAGTERELETGFCKRFTSNGGDPAVRWKSVVNSLPWWWQRLQGVTILNEDALKLVERIEDKAGTVIYCDPPYFEKSAEYLFDFDAGMHKDLAEKVRRFQKTRVVISYYNHPLIQSYYIDHGFTMIDAMTKKVMNPGVGEDAPEVLLVKN